MKSKPSICPNCRQKLINFKAMREKLKEIMDHNCALRVERSGQIGRIKSLASRMVNAQKTAAAWKAKAEERWCPERDRKKHTLSNSEKKTILDAVFKPLTRPPESPPLK
jgi:hypothetical protein